MALPQSIKIRDAVARGAEIKIFIQSEDYRRSRKGLVTREAGTKFSLVIKGKPGFCLAALQNLIGLGHRAYPEDITPSEVFAAHADEMRQWNLRTPLRDLFQRGDVMNFEITGHSHAVKRTLLIKNYELGPKCTISIAGKPGFAQVAAAQINLNAPFLQKMLSRMLDT